MSGCRISFLAGVQKSDWYLKCPEVGVAFVACGCPEVGFEFFSKCPEVGLQTEDCEIRNSAFHVPRFDYYAFFCGTREDCGIRHSAFFVLKFDY